MRTLMFFATFLLLSSYPMSDVSAQSVPQQSLGTIMSPYPGAIYVSPQDSSFGAPGIYRSLNPTDHLESPLQVTQICTRDFRETAALKSLFSASSEAPGIDDSIHKDFAAKLSGLNMRVISADGNVDVKDEASYTATPLEVQSADDDISTTVLANIGDSCKKIIREHLSLGRIVFIAVKAIRAKNFAITFTVGPKAGAGVKCSLSWFCPSASVDIDRQKTVQRKATRAVTFAIVPADIDGRSLLTATDIN